MEHFLAAEAALRYRRLVGLSHAKGLQVD